MEVEYKGGFDSLSRTIASNVMAFDFNVEKDYFLFFELSLNRDGKIDTVKPAHIAQDDETARVYKALLQTSQNWVNNSGIPQKVVVPVFLIADKEASGYKNTYTVTSNDYLKSSEFVKCFFTKPIVINFYHQRN